eukprot:TRINITY_DN66208_c12_g5_i1.p1 TRINITY_DN66208_c12_g5~~TRINITY_DN66208_c12_g5_i1.p1  ORF type:complete len:684 (+),score=68.51 TRINITY_DN66208_c12_g5_i1:18-2069(+)
MKLVLVGLVLLPLVLANEVVKEGMFADRHTYSVSGKVQVVKLDSGKHRLEYTQYSQQSGPKVFQYACPAVEPSTIDDCLLLTPPIPPGNADGRIPSASSTDFIIADLPDSFDPTTYKSITAWCTLARRAFGVAALQVVSGDKSCTAAANCNGKGTCIDAADFTKGCACDYGYFGEMCQGTCPGGASTPCNNNGACLSSGYCKCLSGFLGEACESSGWEVGVMTKTNASPQVGVGFAEGFTLGAVETPEITLMRGTRYTFVVNADGHPLYISSSVEGAGAGEITGDAVINSRAQQGSTLGFTPEATHGAGDQQLYYQCFIHKNMGWKIKIADAKTCDAGCKLPNGVCDTATGQCRCIAGWTGANCDTCTAPWTNADGKCTTCPLPARLVAGKCVTDCAPGQFGSGCSGSCPKAAPTDYSVCAGRGYCNEGADGDGKCVCDSDRKGTACTEAVEPPPADFFVYVEQKVDGEHPWFGQGDANGYALAIQNPGKRVQGRELVLRCYVRYIFEVKTPCEHPFVLTTSEKGGTNEQAKIVEDQVAGNMACEGTRVTFTPHIGLPQTIYYQCHQHEQMGGKITLLLPGVCPPQGCGDHGDCDTETGECTCRDNYTGNLCEIDPDNLPNEEPSPGQTEPEFDDDDDDSNEVQDSVDMTGAPSTMADDDGAARLSCLVSSVVLVVAVMLQIW